MLHSDRHAPAMDQFPPRGSPMIVTKHLGVEYRFPSGHTSWALQDVSFDLMPSEWTAVVGPSGSGKSTLLHVIGGLQRPTTGSVEVCGSRLDLMEQAELAQFRRRTVGFVFQAFHLMGHLTAWENVALPLVAEGIPLAKRRVRALEVLDEVGVGQRSGHRPGELSGGEQQRVALARAVVNNPRVLIADEPTGNLDQVSGSLVLELMTGIVQKGTAVVCATHDMAIAEAAQRRVDLWHGQLTSSQPSGPHSARR